MEQEDFWKVVQANRVSPKDAIDKSMMYRGFYNYPFCVMDLFHDVKVKRIKTGLEVCQRMFKNKHKHNVLRYVFNRFLEHMIDDIIDNNDQFIIRTGDSYVSFQMEKLPMNVILGFRKLSNYLDDLDPFESEGNAYMIMVKSIHDITTCYNKYVIVDKNRRKRINQKTNEGKRW